MQDKSCVYWIHTLEQIDIFTQGYVGVCQKGAEHRYNSHKSKARNGSKLPIHAAIRKYADELICETVLNGPIEYCFEMEFKLRPTQGIGYNIDSGGNCNRLGAKLSDETKAKQRAKALATGRKPNQLALDNSAKTNSKRVA